MKIVNYKIKAISSQSFRDLLPFRDAFIVTDAHVAPLYLDSIIAILKQARKTVVSYIFPPGEQSKSVHALTRLCTTFYTHKLDRGSLVIALGGGVVGDLTGFASAIYRRGLRYIQIPTTLIAQVDSAVPIESKVSINGFGQKNYIGTYYTPECVFVDIGLLSTLPITAQRDGFAEIIKAAVIGDAFLFDLLENLPDLSTAFSSDRLSEIIRRAVTVKVNVIDGAKKCKSNYRDVLNFGHTIAHALEGASKNTITHGMAVATGIVAETQIALEKKILRNPSLVEQVKQLTTKLSHEPSRYDLPVEKVLRYAQNDKKATTGKYVFALPQYIGSVLSHVQVHPKYIRRVLITLNE